MQCLFLETKGSILKVLQKLGFMCDVALQISSAHNWSKGAVQLIPTPKCPSTILSKDRPEEVNPMSLQDQTLHSFKVTSSPLFHRSDLNPSYMEKEIAHKFWKFQLYRQKKEAQLDTEREVMLQLSIFIEINTGLIFF